MKKLFISLLAVASVIACTKSNVEFEETAEIGLKPVAHNVTKSMMTGKAFQTSESFNVWAFYKQVNPGTSIADWQAATGVEQTTYIDEKTFENVEGTTTWHGVHSYYWPKMGSLLFAGYYPTTVKDQVDYTFDGNVNQMVIKNYVPDRVVNPKGETTTYEEDLMYANMTPASVTKNNVSLVFNHALSWITVKVQQSVNTGETGPKITVNSVTFEKVSTKGDATVNNIPLSVGAAGETKDTYDPIKWVPSGDAADIQKIEVVTEELVKADDKKVRGIELGTAAKALEYEPLFIPQPMTNMVVNYTIESEDGSSFTETTTITLNTLKTDDGKEATNWEPGKHYTYTITIGTTEILVAPSVTAWDNVNYTVPVEKPAEL